MNELLKHNNDEHERCQREYEQFIANGGKVKKEVKPVKHKLTKMQKAQKAGYERRTNKK